MHQRYFVNINILITCLAIEIVLMKKYAYDLLLMIKLDNEDIWYIDDMGGYQI